MYITDILPPQFELNLFFNLILNVNAIKYNVQEMFLNFTILKIHLSMLRVGFHLKLNGNILLNPVSYYLTPIQH